MLRSAMGAHALAVITFVAPAAFADQVGYGTRHVQGSSYLVRFDPTNPSDASLVGAMGTSMLLHGLDFAGNSLYAYSGAAAGAGQGGLYSVNSLTGAATYVGGSNLNGYSIVDLAFNRANDTLYGLGVVPGNNSNFARLYQISTATGLVTGQQDIWGTVDIQLTGLGITPTGEVYAVDNVQDALWSIAPIGPNLHQATRVGVNLSGGALISDQGFYIHSDGTAYLAANTFGGNSIRTVDLATGLSTGVGSVPGFAPNLNITSMYDITIVPAPGAAALLGLGGLMGARRRRR